MNFAASETSKTFTVPVLEDTSAEGSETFNLTLSSPSGGISLGSPSTAVVTIVDNDGGGGCSTAITVGQTINGTLTTSDCIFSGTTRYVDVYTFTGTAGQQVVVAMNSSAFDTFLYLVNSGNQTLAQDDDGGGGTNSRIPTISGTFTLPASGTYQIYATSYSADGLTGSTGAYSISLSGPSCSYSLSPTSQSFGSAGGGGSFNVTTAAGCSWSAVSNAGWLTTNSSNSGSGTVSYTVAANTGAARTGTITVGGQTFTVNQSAGGGGCPTTAISAGQTLNGTLTTSDCIFSGTTRYVDVYTFSGTSGQQVFVTMNSSVFDTYIYLLNAGNQTIAQDDDGGGGTNSRIPASGTFTLPASGNYTIYATAYSFDGITGSTGAYSISLSTPGALSVQFASGASTLNETLNATTKVDISVTRVGSAAQPAAIDYATADGTASQRSDYLASLGTLRFAAGEVTKTFSVFIVDDRFGETAESFSVVLSNPVGCTIGSPSAFAITIGSNESVNGANPVRDASFNSDFFVREHYVDFFNREADPSGLAFWKDQIDSCTTPACREIRRINVSAAFFLSIEFQQTGYLVERLYKTAYGSAVGTSTLDGPHQLSVPIVRLNEFLPDTQQIGRGVVIGTPGADQLLEDNKQVLIAEFVQRPRFLTAYPVSLTPAQFVDQLNTNAGLPLSPAERNQLVTELTLGLKSRAQVLRAIAEDLDLVAAEQNRAFVLAQFFGYLRRNPNDSPDSDYTGYDFWLRKLNQFNGNFVNAEMVKAFIVSGEYQLRFGP